jgi:cell division protein FtsB
MFLMSEKHLRARGGGKLSPLSDALPNALCACVISYCVVSFFAGQAGLLAYGDLKSGITRMNERIRTLSQENATLVDMRKELLSNSEKMIQEARQIGYVRPGEKMVIFSGAPPAKDSPAVPDVEPLKAGTSTGLPDRMIKILAAMTGAAVFLASLVMSAFQPRKRYSPAAPTADRS